MSSRLLTVPGSPGGIPKPRLPVLRLSENFFQRWLLILLPIAIMGAIGMLMAQRVSPTFEASATLSTSANPLVGSQEIRGQSVRFLESPAQATARVVRERLGTDRFATSVAERAGLDEAVDSGFLELDDLRRGMLIFPSGEALVDVQANWGDPDTSLQLVEAVIAEYLSVLQSTVSEDAQSAVEFYQSRRAEAAVRAEAATTEYEAFVDTLPALSDDEELPLAQQLELTRLNERLTSAQGAIDSADSAIEEAKLTVVQAQSEAGRSIDMVDPPTANFEPESTLRDKAIIFIAFVFLGTLVAITILLLTTHLDRSVRSVGDIEAAGGGATVAAVPVIKSLRPRTRMRRIIAMATNMPRQVFGRLRSAS